MSLYFSTPDPRLSSDAKNLLHEDCALLFLLFLGGQRELIQALGVQGLALQRSSVVLEASTTRAFIWFSSTMAVFEECWQTGHQFPNLASLGGQSAPPKLIISWQTSQQLVGGSYSPANRNLAPKASRRGRYSARMGCTIFPSNPSQVLLAESTRSQLTPLLQQSCGVPHFQESYPALGPRVLSRIYPQTGSNT